MFKTASYFRIADDFVLPELQSLEEALQASRFEPCGATQPESSGWVPPRGGDSEVLAERVGTHVLLQLCTERRPVPSSAIKDAVELRVQAYKKETGRDRVGAKLKKEFKEDAVLELLPRAFTKRSSTLVWLDVTNKFLVVNSSSLTGADKVVTFLVEALASVPGSRPGIGVKPVQTQMSATASMSHWLSSREAPYRFTVDQDCELKMPDDQKSAVRYSRHTLEIDEVAQHIASGKLPTQLALTWNSRVSFLLNEAAQVKKIKLLDVVLEGAPQAGEDDGFDANAAIVTGELSALLPDLLEALGGEMGVQSVEAGLQAPAA